MYYRFLRIMADMGRLTAAQAWKAADDGLITSGQAEELMGPRPSEAEADARKTACETDGDGA